MKLYRLLGIKRLTGFEREIRKLDADYYLGILSAHGISAYSSFKDRNACATIVVNGERVEFPAYWRKDYDQANDAAWDRFWMLLNTYKKEAA